MATPKKNQLRTHDSHQTPRKHPKNTAHSAAPGFGCEVFQTGLAPVDRWLGKTSGKHTKKRWKITMLSMGKSTMNIAMFNSKLFNYQRLSHYSLLK